jgi:hypothetical protein
VLHKKDPAMSEQQDVDKPKAEALPSELTFHNLKSNFFRVIHVDGVSGSLTPSGYLQMAVYNERQPNPTKQTYRVKPDGTLGSEVLEKRESREDVVRELEAEMILNLTTAGAMRDWLTEWLDRAGKLIEQAAQAQMAPEDEK